MPAIRLEVWWSDVSREIIAPNLEQSVGDVIELIRKHVGIPLPEEDSLSHPIEYALYKEVQGHRIALRRRLPLQRAHVQPDNQLYFANRKAPWWDPACEWIPKDDTPPITSEVISPGILADCRLQLAPGCIITIPPDGMQIDRKYLIDNLPRLVLAREEALAFMKRSSRLKRVSRNPHCKFLRGNNGWELHALMPTYINGNKLPTGAIIPLKNSMTIVLGPDGWPIEVHLDTHTIERTKA